MADTKRERLLRWLEVPDALGGVPARYLSGQGFAERLLRLIAEQEAAGAPPASVVSVIREHCERAVLEQEEVDDDDGR